MSPSTIIVGVVAMVMTNLLATKAPASSNSNGNVLDVCIIGAGPTGLTAAAEAGRLGLSFRIIDRKCERSTHDSRALVVHPRPMELLRAAGGGGVTDKFLDLGFKLETLNVYFGPSRTHIDVNLKDGVSWGDTSFPFLTSLPQYNTERVLEDDIEARGGRVEWSTSIKSISQGEGLVDVTIAGPDGTDERITSRYVVGCDGGRSTTRDLVGLRMRRAKSKIYFVVADITLTNSPFEEPNATEPHVYFHPEGFTILFPLPGRGSYRFVGEAPRGVTKESDIELDDMFFDDLLQRRTGHDLDCKVGQWATVFEITHGIADSYQRGRVFLAGDAAHVHSPVGGQGMNFGMQDAVNLVWKLAWAENSTREAMKNGKHDNEKLPDAILSSYDAERRSLGSRLLRTTETGTAVFATHNVFLQKLRNVIMKNLLRKALRSRARTIGQLTLRYLPRTSPIICDRPAHGGPFICDPGERLPNLRTVAGERLYDKVDRSRHTWVVIAPDLPPTGNETNGPGGLKLVKINAAFGDQNSKPKIPKRVLEKPQAILVRPDLYVAAVDTSVGKAWKRMVKLLPPDASMSM